ncbi:hypothetical protein CRI93_11760 [Longimonas halophila]|uniref:Uncharacterized protein n=1 Tax=Longimonas halophila TaxID=1469170 RepID=A0A2H3NJG6_9BACT|nr:hypothetical protein CRI93_11760 [Longimonas halophila]
MKSPQIYDEKMDLIAKDRRLMHTYPHILEHDMTLLMLFPRTCSAPNRVMLATVLPHAAAATLRTGRTSSPLLHG